MSKMKITITDDAGALEGRVRTGDGGERFAFIRIGALDLSIDGYDEAAAERCQAIAAEFHKIALVLLRPPATMAIACDGGLPPDGPRELSSDEAGAAAGAALSDRARALEARQAPAGEGPKS